MLTVYTVDFAQGVPAVDADAVFTGADTVYASPSSLYVATQSWEGGSNSSIHRFDTSDPARTEHGASGAVPGTLLDQFALSGDAGVLRAATTAGSGRDAESMSLFDVSDPAQPRRLHKARIARAGRAPPSSGTTTRSSGGRLHSSRSCRSRAATSSAPPASASTARAGSRSSDG